MEDECPTLVPAKVPVTILTGFLGSGKTTLLHYILSADHGLKIAVIVNEFEFGKSIEKGLTLKSSQKSDDEWVELDNGCMCCTSQSQAVIALEKLMRTRTSFDLVLVETAGMADPGPIAAMFWQDEALCGMLYLSGILTLVDAKHIVQHLSDAEFAKEATRQLQVADRILLNKVDLVTQEQLQDAESAVRGVNPYSEIIHTTYSRTQRLQELLFIGTTNSFDASVYSPEHTHGTSVTSVSIEVPNACASSLTEIDYMCRDLLYHETDAFEVVRIKAVLWVANATLESSSAAPPPHAVRPFQLQGICQIFDVTPMMGPQVPERCNRLLILGRRLDETHLRSIIGKYIK